MSNLIKKAAELSVPQTVKMIVYGQAGAGKTTFALSAPKPLLLDFDGGVKRVNLAHLSDVDIVQITSWADVQQVFQEDLSSYQSIVVDTLGKMMDFIISFKCGSRQPQMRDWTGINQEFGWFVRTVSMLNKNVIFVAHRDTRKEGDDTVFVPALREKSYNSIVTDVDLMGYIEMRAENGRVRRVITFDPTNRNDGKNTCNLPSAMEIPTIIDKNGNPTAPNDYIATKIIAPYKAMIQKKLAEKAEYDAKIKDMDELLETVVDADSANNFVQVLANIKHVGNSLQYARQQFSVKVKELGLVYDAKTKTYGNE